LTELPVVLLVMAAERGAIRCSVHAEEALTSFLVDKDMMMEEEEEEEEESPKCGVSTERIVVCVIELSGI